MSLSNPNKPVTEQRLLEFYQQILPYLGGMPDVLANKFARGDMYSTDEKMIGQWIDGKPLYQITVDCGSAPRNETKQIPVTIDNIEHCVGLKIVDVNITDGYNIPFVSITNNSSMEGYFDGTNIILRSAVNWSGTVYATLQYTKTTDSPVEIGLDTDYSTTEKIVGTWIDGKPLYQKSFAKPFTNTSASSYSRLTTSDEWDGATNTLRCVTSAVFYVPDHSIIGLGANAAIGQGFGSIMYYYNYFNQSVSGTCYVTIQYTKTTD